MTYSSMKRIVSFILLFTFFIGYAHDIRMAVFEIIKVEKGLEMHVSVDRYDFFQTLESEYPAAFDTENLEQITLDYLQSKVAIEIDGKCSDFEIEEIEYYKQNILIKGSLNLDIDEINEVKMTNTCMIDSIEGHDNIMKLKLNDRTRSFRLNSERTSSIASY